MDVLVIIDMQNDFISGSLGSDLAQAIVNNVVKKASEFKGKILFTRDTHSDNYLETLEGKNLPVKHCIKDTQGWQICHELKELSDNSIVIDKPAFGSIDLPAKIREVCQNNDDLTITLVGLCTDICVISNAMVLKANFPETKIIVVENCCAGVTVESHINAINAMKMCQIEIEG